MKKNIIPLITFFSVLLALTACIQNKESSVSKNDSTEMKVTSVGLKNGKWGDEFGQKGSQKNENNIPNFSIPFKIENESDKTKSFAIVLEDKDAYPVTKGITWIHWMAANIKKNELKANESIVGSDFVQGANSWMTIEGGEQSKELSSYYGGMAPPDKPHTYELHVFALDTELNLDNGFMYNELYEKMKNHILETYTLEGTYSN